MPGFGSVGPWEIILILAVLLLVFGAKRLPEIGAALGKGIREFKGSVKEIENEFNRPQNLPPQAQQQPSQPPAQQAQPAQQAPAQEQAAPTEAPTEAPREVESTRPGGTGQ